MTYVISDISGQFEQLTELLEKIRFSENDVLYVLGDQVGSGSGSMEVLCDLSMRPNVYPIAGDKDFLALRMLGGFQKTAQSGETPSPEFISEMTAWVAQDGGAVLGAFRELDEDLREGVLDYLSEMTLYEEAEVKGHKYLLVHAGVRGYDPDKSLEDYSPEDFFTESPDFTKGYAPDLTVVVGHLPTHQIPGAVGGRIFRAPGVIAMDCGAQENGTLGCLCLESGEEFYV